MPVSTIKKETPMMDWAAEELFRKNVGALESRDPQLARILETTPIPQHIQLARARDGSITYQIEIEGKKRWLGYSSVPAISAAANAARVKIDGGNLAMSGIGHGLEAKLILEKLARHQALFALESDPLNLVLALGLRDFTEELADGRLILLLGEPVAALIDFFQNHPGYNAITQGVAWPWLTEQENHARLQPITAAMDAVMGRILTQIQKIQNQIAAADQARSWEEVKQALAEPARLVALNYGGPAWLGQYCLTRDLLAGLAALGARSDWQAQFAAEAVSPLAQAQRIADRQPHLVLLADTFRFDAGSPLPEKSICLTLLSPGAKLPDLGKLGRFDLILPATAAQHEELLGAGIPAARLCESPPLVNTGIFRPLTLSAPEQAHYAAEVTIIAERFATDPEAYEIRLPSHVRLWQEVIRLIEARPEEWRPELAPDYLHRAQACGVQLREEALQTYFARIIRECLAPSVLLDCYGRALVQAGYMLKVWSLALDPRRETRIPAAWAASPLAAHFAGCLTPGPELNRALNASSILVHLGADGSLEPVLEAAAAGCMILARHAQDGGLGRYFTREKEIITFTTPRELVRQTRKYLQNPPQRCQIAQLAAERVARYDSTQQLKILLKKLAGFDFKL